jgi:hypothetical protein
VVIQKKLPESTTEKYKTSTEAKPNQRVLEKKLDIPEEQIEN